VLVLSSEGLTALHAALDNQLQRAVNVCLGSALATIGLTIPAVLMIGLLAGSEVHLGLDQLQAVLLTLTLFVSALTFGVATPAPMCCRASCTCSYSWSMWR
jgi:Ca2+:H+ antiporter